VTRAGTPAECVVNISEGRDPTIIEAVADAAGDRLLDVHTDPDHHRSVLTLGGPLAEVEEAARAVATAAVAAIDLARHRGVHPRLGAVDVVPFVPLEAAGWDTVLGARDDFARWAGAELGVPCFLYGTDRTLPEVRRGAFTSFPPDTGPSEPHPTAGATAVGARDVLIAYNVWIGAVDPGRLDPDGVVDVSRALATALRRPGLRTLGLAVGDGAQVSCNIIDPARVGVAEVYDAVVRGAEAHGCTVRRGELVGLLPDAALYSVEQRRWPELGLRADDTIEFRLDTRRG